MHAHKKIQRVGVALQDLCSLSFTKQQAKLQSLISRFKHRM